MRSDRDRLVDLLSRTAQAHHQAFAATDGFDPDWLAWYASHLIENGFEHLPAPDLARLLAEADRRYRGEARDESWAVFYANFLTDRF